MLAYASGIPATQEEAGCHNRPAPPLPSPSQVGTKGCNQKCSTRSEHQSDFVHIVAAAQHREHCCSNLIGKVYVTRREGLSPSHLFPPSTKRLWLPRPQNPTQLFIKDAQHAFRHTMLALQTGIVQHSYLVPDTSLCSADSPCKAPQSSLHGGAHAPSTVTNPVIQDPAAVTQLQRATNIRLQQTALLLNKAQHQPAESTRIAAEHLSALCTMCWVVDCLPVHSQLIKAVDACVVLSAESGDRGHMRVMHAKAGFEAHHQPTRHASMQQ